MSRALALLLIVTLVLFACVSRLRSAPAVPATVMAELARLRSENDRLKLKLSSCEAIAAASSSSTPTSGSSSSGGGSGGASGGSSGGGSGGSSDGASGGSSGGSSGATASASAGSGLTRELLELHSHWDWQAIARTQLQPFVSIDSAMIDAGIKECYQNGTMYCSRVQVIAC